MRTFYRSVDAAHEDERTEETDCPKDDEGSVCSHEHVAKEESRLHETEHAGPLKVVEEAVRISEACMRRDPTIERA